MMDGFLDELGMVLSALARQQAASPLWARLYDNVARYAIKIGLVRASHARSNCVVDCDLVATVLLAPQPRPVGGLARGRLQKPRKMKREREKALGLSALGD